MKAFLFDLDGTLLLSNEETFYNRYFELVGKEFEKFVNPKDFIDAINRIIKAMISDDGSKDNYQNFMENISKRFDKNPGEIEKRFMDFYCGNFKLLKPLTKPNDNLIAQLRALNGIKVLATNPIFPEIAIRERMKWAGLKDEDFTLVTFMENSHYLKPNPKYFLEISNKIGAQSQDCTMIGNDPVLDGACEKIGMKFVLIGDEDGQFKDRIEG